jgi:acyl-CoA thioesterase-2
VGDLGVDTAVSGGDGVYEATLSRDWEIWGPMGGYVVATALRAAGAHTGFARPASVVAHYLGVAEFGTVTLTTSTLRAAKKAESIRVSVAQADRPVLEALVWAVDGELPALVHDVSPIPGAAGTPSDHPTVQERLTATGSDQEAPYRFWENFESRPVMWVDEWEARRPEAPEWLEWLRFVPEPDTKDPWIDAARLAILVDVGSWPAVVRHHVDTKDLYAPSIDLACHFHRLCPGSSYLLAKGASPSAAEGLVTSHQSVWADDGTFLASGISQLLCRPMR